MLSKVEAKIVLICLLFLVPVVGGLTTFVVLQVHEQNYFENDVNGYVAPKWLGETIAPSQDSLVTLKCEGQLGSGFSFDLDEVDAEEGVSFNDVDALNGKTKIVTNAHVINGCIKDGRVEVIVSDQSSHVGTIVRVDVKSDLALLTIPEAVVPLYATYQFPFPGFWVMALGSPHSFAGSVTFGNVINSDPSAVYSTASLSPGNSGGPLLDNEGLVFGINSGSKPIGQNFNISISVNMLCEEILSCTEKRFTIK